MHQACNVEVYTSHFAAFEALVAEYNLDDDRIWNLDEKGCTPGRDITGMRRQRRFHRRGSGTDAKVVEFINTHHMTMMPVISASGEVRLSVPVHRSADALTNILTVEQLRELLQEMRRVARQRILGASADITASGHVDTASGAVLTTSAAIDLAASKVRRDTARLAEKAAAQREKEARQMQKERNDAARAEKEALEYEAAIHRAEMHKWSTRERLCGVSLIAMRASVRPMSVRREIARARATPGTMREKRRSLPTREPTRS